MHIHTSVYIYIYMVTPPPMIHPSLLVNCSSTILCLRMLSPKSINHRYLRGFMLFTYTDLCLLCSFLVNENHPKPKPESGSASALKHLSPSQQRQRKPQLFLLSWCYFLSLEILFHHEQWLGLNEPLQSANTTKLNLNVSEKKVVSLQQIPNTFGGMSRYVELLTLYNFITRKPE